MNPSKIKRVKLITYIVFIKFSYKFIPIFAIILFIIRSLFAVSRKVTYADINNANQIVIQNFKGLEKQIEELEEDVAAETEELAQHKICENAWTTLYNLGRDALDSVAARAAGKKRYGNANAGKRKAGPASKKYDEAYEHIHKH